MLSLFCISFVVCCQWLLEAFSYTRFFRLAKDITPDEFDEPSMRTKNIKITGGFIKGDKAQLVGEGFSPITETNAKVFVYMAKTMDGWKVARQREQ